MFVIASNNNKVMSEFFLYTKTEQDARMLLQQRALEKTGINIKDWQFDILPFVPDGCTHRFIFVTGGLN